MIITSKFITKIKAAWFRSQLRVLFLSIKHLYWPSLFSDKPIVEVYLALNDPHSFMLVQVLADIEQRFAIKFKLYLVYKAVPGVTIHPKLMRNWALNDANYISKQYGLKSISSLPTAKALLTGQQIWQLSPKTVESAENIFYQTWFGEFTEFYSTSTPVINFQIKNQQRLIRKGHYLSAAIFFAGDWFIGIDRLFFLEDRLTKLGLNLTNDKSKYHANQLACCSVTAVESSEEKAPIQLHNTHVCEVYISLRSPYSYLGFIKVKKLAQKYQVPMVIKPVVPMVMRGLNVPISKMRYTYIDANREAKLAHIPFRAYNDPIGQGIVNCYQIFSYAEKNNKSVAFIEATFEAIYVKNLDVAQSHVIQTICHDIGLDYNQALEHAKENDWQQWSDTHQAELEQLGLWGVPCFKYDDISCWGQDRLVQIEQAMINNSPTSQAKVSKG
ncbi:DsbA family protein [Colwelliaceae bacterium 6441]